MDELKQPYKSYFNRIEIAGKKRHIEEYELFLIVNILILIIK